MKNGLWDGELKSVSGIRRGIGGVGSVVLFVGRVVGAGALAGGELGFDTLERGVAADPLGIAVPLAAPFGVAPLIALPPWVPLKNPVLVAVPPLGDEVPGVTLGARVPP